MSLTDLTNTTPFLQQIEKKFKELETQQKELAIQHSQAVVAIGKAMTDLVQFVTNGGLAQLLHQHTKQQTVNHLLQGLASKDGRGALDARTIRQNAIEGWHATDVWDEVAAERESEKSRVLEEGGEVKDLNSEADYEKWKKGQE